MQKASIDYKKIFAVLLTTAVCLLFQGCADTKYADLNSAREANAIIGENIFIDDVKVSRMSVEEALKMLESKHEEVKKSKSFTLSTENGKVSISGAELPIRFNSEEVVLEAVNMSKYWPENNGRRELYTSVTIDENEAVNALETLTDELNVKAENAVAEYDASKKGGFRYNEHKNGQQIDLKDAAKKLAVCISEGTTEIQALTTETNAEYTLDNAKNDNALVSEFVTSFAGETYSKPNRVFNITKAAGLIDGVRLDVGEEFNMNQTLGDRNYENGWKEATGIRDGKYVQEYGGGVCQVSTTLYNAVLMADLEITDRSHHSWPLGYIDVGRDATISTGGPNFKFRNTSDAPITISAATDDKNKTVTVRIYGRKSKDYSSITLTSKQTDTLEDLGNEIVVDKTLAKGSKKVERESRVGVVAKTYKQYRDENGNIIKTELVATDKYRSVKGLIYVSEDMYDDSVAATGNDIAITQEESVQDWTDYFSAFEE
ncbi:MAG: VanW family protein [Clostridia bacterium]|nr:VanW family protein [Clostridia bacterium]